MKPLNLSSGDGYDCPASGAVHAIVGSQHTVQIGHLQQSSDLRGGLRDAQAAAGLAGGFQPRDQSAESGRVDQVDTGKLDNQVDISPLHPAAKLLTQRDSAVRPGPYPGPDLAKGSRFAFAKAIIIEVPIYGYDRYHVASNLNSITDGFRVLWTVLLDRMYGRRYRELAKRLRSAGSAGGKPFWMLANPRAEAPHVGGPDFPAEIQRTLGDAWAQHPEVPAAIRMDLAIAAAEVGNNVLDYAGRGRDLRVQMVVLVLGDHVRLEFIDDGVPADMDLASMRMPDVMAKAVAALQCRGRRCADCPTGELARPIVGR